MSDFDSVKAAYLAFPDKSDFVPSQDSDGNPVLFYYGEGGLRKARFLCFSLGASLKMEEVPKQRVFELLESFGGDIDEVAGEEAGEDLLDDDANILVASYDDAPVIKLVNQIIISAVKSGASDIHFEGRDTSFLIRFRVDGKLATVKKYPKTFHDTILARIKVIASLDVAETRKAQDGRVNLKIGNREIDIRVSTVPSVSGEKCVLRILERSKEQVSLEQVGMPATFLKQYRPFLQLPNGIILVTGPTGSGKTTTLYASLMEVDRENKNVVTIEDPVEYQIDNITQVQVNAAVNLTFASAIRTFLRQDPDVMLVGEIRDEETAEAAIQASLTGHLVLSTLHTNDAPTAIARLIEMDVEPFLVSSALKVVIGQRLVRKVCTHCSSEVEADDTVRDYFKDLGFKVKKYMKGAGCDHCFHTGYRGRIGVFELMALNDEIRMLINRKASAFEIKEAARKFGYVPMVENGVQLIKEGITSPEEIIAVTRMD